MTLQLSVVVPMFNEADALPALVARLRPVLDGLDVAYEVVAVDDGSTDATPARLQAVRREWDELRVIRLRTNAGHQAAMSAGLAAARGDWVVTMDADLQDPPELIPDLLGSATESGVDVVQGVRLDRSSDSTFKRASARIFYALIAAIARTPTTPQGGDFRLMSRATVEAVNSLPEHHRVLRFLIPELGFPTRTVGYVRDPRVAGTSKYPFLRMLRLSIDSLTGFSTLPLRLATLAGLVTAVLAALVIIYIVASVHQGRTVAGWASTVTIVAGVGAVQLMCLGIIGEYIARLYVQVQGRPTYYVAYDSAAPHPGPTDGPLPAEPSDPPAPLG